jgi:hypothetical protein
MPQRAIGLPDPTAYGDVSRLPVGQLLDYVAQLHDARRVGRHVDLRFGTPQSRMYSWALRKGLPEPGKKHLAVQQPLHEHGYSRFEGVIPRGYGAGTVRIQDAGKVLITRSSPQSVHFTIAHKGIPERYVLVNMGKGRNWLLVNTTPRELVPYAKRKFSVVPAADAEKVLEKLPGGHVVQPKVDGAAVLLPLLKDKIEVTSYRQSKRRPGFPITHTERFFGGTPKIDLPRQFRDSVLRGEVYGLRGGKAIHPAELGGLLNASLARSLAEQKKRKIDLQTMLFDIQRLKGKPVNLPYAERRKLLQEILPHLPAGKFHLPEEASTPAEAQALWRKIIGGQHPLTREGVVIHPPEGMPTKIKARPEFDVHLTGVFPGAGKYHETGAGGYTYSLTPGGRTAGRVGTGLSDALRRELLQDPEAFIGRVARIGAQEQLPSGAYRAPGHLGFHEDYPLAPAKEASAKMTEQEAFLAGALLRCADERLDEKATKERLDKVAMFVTHEKVAQMGEIWRGAKGLTGGTYSTAKPWVQLALLGLPLLAGASLGGIVGHGLSNPLKPEDVRMQELIDEYRRSAKHLRASEEEDLP